MTALLLTNHPQSAENVTKELAATGIEVGVLDSPDPLSEVIASNPDVVIIDLLFWRGEGLKFADRLRQLPSPPLIALLVGWPGLQSLEAYGDEVIQLLHPVTSQRAEEFREDLRRATGEMGT